MKYGMIGEDKASPEEKIAKYTGIVAWSYLKPHYESDALYFLDPGISLEEAGLAITADDKKKVAAWLKSGDLVKIGALHAAQWEKAESKTNFRALVVSPFVLCQPVTEHA